jgi:hypothetical protein
MFLADVEGEGEGLVRVAADEICEWVRIPGGGGHPVATPESGECQLASDTGRCSGDEPYGCGRGLGHQFVRSEGADIRELLKADWVRCL